MKRWLALAVVAMLAACEPPPAPRSVEPPLEIARVEVADATEDARVEITETAIPLMLDIREVVEEIAPPAAIEPTVEALMTPAGKQMLISHEVVSREYYVKRLQGVVCPGGSSGPTRGIGWDDGPQTRERIAAAWNMHPQLAMILPASGQTGPTRCNAFRRANPGIRTPLDMAETVFERWAIPDYHKLTARTFRRGFDQLPPEARDSLVITVYNRGAGMSGRRRLEMRVLRDECVPRADVACMAAQYRSMPRLWAGTDIAGGMARRYEETAQLAEGRLH